MELLLQFIPIFNAVQDIRGAVADSPPEWWQGIITVWTNIAALQYVILPALDKLADLTPWGWDDTAVGKTLNVVGGVTKFILSLASADPALKERLENVRDSFKRR